MNSLNLVIGAVALAALVIVWTIIELIGRLLDRQRTQIQEEAKTTLKDMFIFIDPMRMFYYNAAALFILPTLIWFLTGNPLFTGAAAVAIVLLPMSTDGVPPLLLERRMLMPPPI